MRRVNQTEQMDLPDLDPELLSGDLRNLELLNRFFGGLSLGRRLLEALLPAAGTTEPLAILDVGSGAADLCRETAELCRRRDIPARIWSLDSHGQIQGYARERCRAYPGIRFLRGDARRLPLRSGAVDLALCTLALHHFSGEDAVRVLAELRRVARRAAAVADLRRGGAALGAVWLVTRLTRNPMTRFDGPASVRRAYTLPELRELAERAGWGSCRPRPEPWFRMSLVWKGEPW